MKKYEKLEYNGHIYTRSLENKTGRRNYFYRENGSKTLHREMWKDVNGEIPKGHHIHHKDGNPLNNNIENLECLSHKEHMHAHSVLAKIDPSKDIFKTRKDWQRSPDGIMHHRKIGKENWKKRQKVKRICITCLQEEWVHTTVLLHSACKNCRGRNGRKKPVEIKQEKFIPIMVKCTVCENFGMQKTRRNRLFCSKNCLTASRVKSNIDNVERKCAVCSKCFNINRYSKTKTCSDSCRSELISISMKSRRSL